MGTDEADATDPDDAAVREMVADLAPRWRVDAVERSDQGTDFVATIQVRTPAGERRVVLKAATADHLDDEVARAEPRLLELVGSETSIPVPAVFGYRDEHPEYPAPFFLLEYVEGENYENRSAELSATARERVLREAGEHLAALHRLGPLPAAGTIGVPGDRTDRRTVDGTSSGGAEPGARLAVLDDGGRYDDPRDAILAGVDDALDRLPEGGYFPDHAAEPDRFADLVPDLRAYLHDRIPALPEPEPPTYCHTDYRYGNLLLDPDSGAARAVIDWGNLDATDPAYNLASAESLLLSPEREDDARIDRLRGIFRGAYSTARTTPGGRGGDPNSNREGGPNSGPEDHSTTDVAGEGWTFDDAVRERVDVYHLVCRVHAMSCLPLWYPDPDERDRREREHRRFVARYVEE